MQTLKRNFVLSPKVSRLFFLYFLFCLVIFNFSVFATGNKNGNKGLSYLFESGTDGYNTFRIPAMTTTPNGTILAFAEGRKQGSSDTGDIDLVLKRSEDNGRTWSKLSIIWDDGNIRHPWLIKAPGISFFFLPGTLAATMNRKLLNKPARTHDGFLL